MKCLLNPLGPVGPLVPAVLDPSLASLPENPTIHVQTLVRGGTYLFTGGEHTWRSEGQAVVRPAGFGGEKKITKHTDGDEKGEEDHRCDGQTDQSPNAGKTGTQTLGCTITTLKIPQWF